MKIIVEFTEAPEDWEVDNVTEAIEQSPIETPFTVREET